MSSTLQLMQQHRSIRSYQDKPIPSDILDSILDAAWHSPSSINGQQVSLVVVEDAERRRKIAEIAAINGGQPWIAQAPVFITIVIDFYKTRLAVEKGGAKQAIHDSVEGFAVGAVDAGIILGRLMVAAQAAGLGVVPIGGIRRDPQAMIDLLKLPELTFPIVGVSLGYTDQDSQIKPRLPRNSFVHRESYQADILSEAIASYDQILSEHWRTIGRADGMSWSDSITQFYQSVYFPDVAPMARSQGFGFDH